uniref:Uncharacterized protein n=1 Tax=Arundo donax TaxID=35708 RepID=A0A0A9BTZ0_ARUDO
MTEKRIVIQKLMLTPKRYIKVNEPPAIRKRTSQQHKISTPSIHYASLFIYIFRNKKL